MKWIAIIFAFLLVSCASALAQRAIADEAEKASTKFEAQMVFTEAVHRWPKLGQNIPYYISEETLDATALFHVQQAIQHITQNTCLTFKQIDSETAATTRHIRFEHLDDTCESNDVTVVNIGEECERIGDIVHEMGHALGLMDSYRRPDRDQYLYLDPSIANLSEYRPIFNNVVMAFPFDYESIMGPSYSREEMEELGERPLINGARPAGQRGGLSATDAAELNFLYSNCRTTATVCSSPVPADATVHVGDRFTLSFVMNSGRGIGAKVTYGNLPPSTQAFVPSGSVVPALTPVDFVVTGTQELVGQTITVTVKFDANVVNSRAVSCSASVFVKPYHEPLHCFGILADDPTVCNGRGQCLLQDFCNCSGGFLGPECQLFFDDDDDIWVSGYDGTSNTVYDPITDWVSPSLDFTEDFTLDFLPGHVEMFYCDIIVLPLKLQTASTITLIITGGGQPPKIRTFDLPATALDELTAHELEIEWPLPRVGKLRVITSVPAYWVHGNATQYVGSDDTTFGPFKPNRLYFDLEGDVYCMDGFYGPRCADACPGRTVEAPNGAGACNYHGLCHDGANGQGQCLCLGPELSQGCHHVATTCSDFSSDNCPTGSKSSKSTAPCAGGVCSAEMCCAPATFCGTFDGNLCPNGDRLTEDTGKQCQELICTTDDCCKPVDTCGAYRDCTMCAGDSRCGWCASTSTCLNGNPDGPYALTASCVEWKFSKFMCIAQCTSAVLEMSGSEDSYHRLDCFYIKMRGQVNGRPYYRNAEESEACLYFNPDMNRWMLDGDYGCGRGAHKYLAYVIDNATEPALITGTWQVLGANGWFEDPGAKLTCAEPTCKNAVQSNCSAGYVVTESITAQTCCRPGPFTCGTFQGCTAPLTLRNSPFSVRCSSTVSCTVDECCVPAATNCVGQYQDYSECSRSCGGGWKIQKFVVTVEQTSGGTACTAVDGTTKTISCNSAPCGCTSDTFEISRVDVTKACENLNGVYFRVKNRLINNQPVYKTKSGYCLFAGAFNSRWMVGDNSCDENEGVVFAYNQPDILNPWASPSTLAPSVWQACSQADPNQWVALPKMLVSCRPICKEFRCPVKSVLKSGAETVVCPGTKCTAARCCETTATCPANFTCPVGFKIKPKATKVTCATKRCTQADCCQALPYCGKNVACPVGQVAKPNGETIRCKSYTCRQSECCSVTNTCDKFTCADGYVWKPSPALITCAKRKCAQRECCDATGL